MTRLAVAAVFTASAVVQGSIAGAQQQTYDLVIRNGHIIDGTGNPWFAADVGIRGDRIVAIGRLDGGEGHARD